mgnify:CR=1 FL=1
MNGFDRKQFSGVYDFKYSLEGTALKLANSMCCRICSR